MIQKSNMPSWTHSAVHLLVCWYVNMSVCVRLRTKAWSALCLSPSLWTPLGAMLILFFRTTFCRPLGFSQWPATTSYSAGLDGTAVAKEVKQGWVKSKHSLHQQWCSSLPPRAPWYCLHFWALGKNFSAVRFLRQMWAQTQVVCSAPWLLHRIEISLTETEIPLEM